MRQISLNMSVRIGIPRDVKELSTILNDPQWPHLMGFGGVQSMRYNTEIQGLNCLVVRRNSGGY